MKVKTTRYVPQEGEREIPDVCAKVKCCRCYPNSISSEGYCGCCDFNHITGERTTWDPDILDAARPTPESREDLTNE